MQKPESYQGCDVIVVYSFPAIEYEREIRLSIQFSLVLLIGKNADQLRSVTYDTMGVTRLAFVAFSSQESPWSFLSLLPFYYISADFNAKLFII